MEGDDFRRRHFERDPGRGYFMDPARFALDGPYGKKLSRRLSRMEEMLSE